MTKIFSSASITQINTKGMGFGSNKSYELRAEASCQAYNRFVCEKCGKDTGWQLQQIKNTNEKTALVYFKEQDRADAEKKVRQDLETHIKRLESLPESENRTPSIAYLNAKCAKCPSCGHVQSWWKYQDSISAIGCGSIAAFIGLIGILIYFITQDASDIVTIMFVIGGFGVFVMIWGFIAKEIAKHRINTSTQRNGKINVEWAFSDVKPE